MNAAEHFAAGEQALTFANTKGIGSPAHAALVNEARAHFEAAAVLVESLAAAYSFGLDRETLPGAPVVGPSPDGAIR